MSDARESPLFKLGWDYTRKKPSYRQFCQAMSDRFLQLPVDRRLRDTTVGSVRLALALLRPYFHKHVLEDFAGATARVCEMAYVIAQWPSQWWAREHPEIRDLVRCMVHMVGEEMREARRVQTLIDVTKMQEIVGGLEQLSREDEARNHRRRLLADIQLSPEPSPSPTLPPSPTTYNPKELFRLGSVDIVTSDMTESKSTQTDVAEEPTIKDCTSTSNTIPSSDKVSWTHNVLPPSKLEAVTRTASCFLTGLLVGSFIALCVLSPDRRQLAHHLT